jgi:hypothetical protein
MLRQIRHRKARSGAPLLALALLALPTVTGCAGGTPPPATVLALPTGAECAGAVPPSASAEASISALSWPRTLDHPSTPETHRRAVEGLFAITHLGQMLERTLDTSIKVQIDANPTIRPFESVMRKFMAKYLSLEGIREPISRLYMDRFSELEILQLTAFYRTPLGQRTLAELPKIMEEGSKIGMSLVKDHMNELKEMIRAQVERDGGKGI